MKGDREGGRPRETEAALLIDAIGSFQDSMKRTADSLREVAECMGRMKNATEDYVDRIVDSIVDSLKVDCPVCGERVLNVPEHASGMPDPEHGVLEVMET